MELFEITNATNTLNMLIINTIKKGTLEPTGHSESFIVKYLSNFWRSHFFRIAT